MGAYKTDKCFFTDKGVKNVESSVDGYEYVVFFKGENRYIGLGVHDWQNDEWFQKHKDELINKIDKYNKWDMFKNGVTYRELHNFWLIPIPQ